MYRRVVLYGATKPVIVGIETSEAWLVKAGFPTGSAELQENVTVPFVPSVTLVGVGAVFGEQLATIRPDTGTAGWICWKRTRPATTPVNKLIATGTASHRPLPRRTRLPPRFPRER